MSELIDILHWLLGPGRFIFMLVVIPSVVLWLVFTELRRVIAARKWPSVSGVIIRSELVPDDDADSDTGELRTYPVVRYEYEVNGRKMESRRFGIVKDAPLDLSPAELVATYPLGMKLRVYYNPQDVTDSAIVLDLPRRQKKFLVYAVLFAIGFAILSVLLFSPVGELVWEAVIKWWRH